MNNVGTQYSYPMYLGEVPEDQLWDIINVNIGATTLMTRLVIGQMQERRRGAIVNVSSGSELVPLPLMTVYAASKIYIRSFTAALRAEYSRFGITIQHLAPFFVDTKMNAFTDRLQVTNDSIHSFTNLSLTSTDNELQVSTLLVPNAATYAKNAIVTLGKMDSTTGYWAHTIQKICTLTAPENFRTKVGLFVNRGFRQDYLKQKRTN